MYQASIDMISLLPSWMKIRRDPEGTQGGQLLDVLGQQMEEVSRLLEAVLIQRHPASDPFYRAEDGTILDNRTKMVDLYKIDYIWRVSLPPTLEGSSGLSVLGDGTVLRRCTSVFDFYRRDDTNKYYYDRDDAAIYFRASYDLVAINNIVYTELESHLVWGPYDEIGLILGCPRLPGERNDEYRLRLLNVFEAPPGASRQGLLNHLGRSLGLDRSKIRLYEFSDSYVAELYNQSTLDNELWEFLTLAAQVNGAVGSSYWDIIDNFNKGVRYLPIQWDQSLDDWSDAQIQDGIGFDDDLLVSPPQQITNEQEFTYQVGVEGRELIPYDKYPTIDFQYKVYADGQMYPPAGGDGDGIAPEEYGLTIHSSQIIPIKATVKLDKDYVEGPYLPATAYTLNGMSPVTSLMNPLDTTKESVANGEFTYLEVCVPIQDYDRNTDALNRPEGDEGPIGFNRVIVECTDMLDNKREYIFANFDFGASAYIKSTDVATTKFFIPISRAITTTNADNLYVAKYDDNILYSPTIAAGSAPHYDLGQDRTNGAYLGQADHMQNYYYREDWLACDRENSLGLSFNEDGTITIV